MRIALAGLAALIMPGTSAGEWALARPGWTYDFPRDHGPHVDFKTEWWYFTGNLRAQGGRDFGFQLTIFRQGIVPPGQELPSRSRFLRRHVGFAHFAVSDLSARHFHHAQRASRGAFGEIEFSSERVRIEDWEVRRVGLHDFHLAASDGHLRLDLRLRALKAPVVHGEEGISRKAEGEGRASHYYSLTRLEASGVVATTEGDFEVQGLAWFDHEWFTNQLAAGQEGWDWFSLQLSDGSDLMLFQIRTAGGGRDPHSSGTWVDAEGRGTKIREFSLEPTRHWRSPITGGRYPVAWRIRAEGLDLQVEARMDNQELALPPVVYWEGAVVARGTHHGQPISGSGYLEMTGYGGPLAGLQGPEDP